jgi:release factor glutamine methyltransferase
LLEELLERGAGHLRAAGIDNPRLEARLLLAHALGLSQEDLIAGQGAPNPRAMASYERALRRRLTREPLAYILGMREFWSLSFAVGSGVLIPRPDSEVLIEEALRLFPEHGERVNVLDLGTGSGCLLLSFLSERPSARGLGVDISSDALSYAIHNAECLGLSERCGFLQGHWGADVRGEFDVVFINPPYVARGEISDLDPEVGHYEPASALSGGEDGLDSYRSIAPTLGRLLSPGGKAFTEIGSGQADSTAEIFANCGLIISGRKTDLAGRTRCLVVENP